MIMYMKSRSEYIKLSHDIGINFQHWCRPGSTVVNSVYRLGLAQFVRDEKTNCDKISD